MGYYHTCGLLAGGAAYCWGYNDEGQLGTGDKRYRLTPTAVAGLGSGGGRGAYLIKFYNLSDYLPGHTRI